MKTNERPSSGAGPGEPIRLSRFNKVFLLLTAVALVAWVVFLLVLALKY